MYIHIFCYYYYIILSHFLDFSIKMDLWSMHCQPGKEMWIKDLKGWKNVTFAFLFYTVQHIRCLRWHVQLVRKNFILHVCISGFLQVKILLVPCVEIYFDEIYITKLGIYHHILQKYIMFIEYAQVINFA